METTWAHQLRAVGLRVTRPRLSVLDVLADHPHADADTIVTGARAAHPSLSPQAVYGVLKALVAGGLARRIEPAGAPALFELRVGRQPPPPGLPLVRRGRGRRLRRRGGPLPESLGRGRLRRRRGRGRLLGALPRLSGRDAAAESVQVSSTRSEEELPHDRRRIAGPGRQRGRPRRPDQPSGPPGLRQPEPADRGRPWPGDPGELPVPREDQPLRPRADPRAGRARPRRDRLRRLRGRRHRRRRADREVHPRQALPGEGQEDRRRPALLHRRRRPRLLGDGPRPPRLRREVLHRGRQLGPRRQQPGRLLHPRRDQVPRLHPLAEARPGHLRGQRRQPRVRLLQPDARGHAHGHAGLQPARHPGQLPAHAGLRREHLQVGQRRRRDPAGQVPLAAQAGREVPDRRRGRRRPGARTSARTPRTSTTPSRPATSPSGSCTSS